MKVIFLDIDGVMNHFDKVNHDFTPHRWDERGNLLQMDQDKVFLINNMVDLHDFKVVLSSAWRCVPQTAPSWRETMRANGFVFDFLDCTPDNKKLLERGDEIKAWLDAHPEVERYAILDDHDWMLPEQEDNFFLTDPSVGLTQEMANAVVEHLLK